MSLQHGHRLPRVLLIDDDDVVIGSLRRYLISRGWDVETATDPSAIAGEFDAVIVDPYLTGASDGAPSLIAAARTTHPGAALVVLTAYLSREIAQIAADHRALAILTKPHSIVEIADLVAASRAGHRLPPFAAHSKGPVS